ncbi:l-asparaginase [Holotrichia oblita]|uniref:L-asparaginase n=3 Tax=Holotrichia oblita TaxID=644536 RepID=A0ACB9T9M2_HOLOL|nr:l-asparaginase [Holotrichia oblita]KAI4463475.1 l-asparaginase [Holotrichia oblita]KAI4463485.1 l-asparaginase [Holotrichia oblita]
MRILTFFTVSWILLYRSCLGRLVINTWRFPEAADAAWSTLLNTNDAVDALEAGCSYCEAAQCGLTVGFGGSPDESGETTLDSLIFYGKTMNAGAIANLRRVKNAMSVARHVLQHTKHTLLSGDQATAFALAMGFSEESLITDVSTQIWANWTRNNCQPNFWQVKLFQCIRRVGDSPMPGAGAYADNAAGAACATGNGDIMMRFLPSFLAVEKMRDGASPAEAAKIAVARIVEFYPEFSGAVIAVSVNGEYGAACNGMAEFPFAVRDDSLNGTIVLTTDCTNAP